MESDLQALRSQIDDLDEQIVTLISRRAQLAGEIGRLKSDRQLPVKDEGREQAVLIRVLEYPHHPVTSPDLAILYKLIMKICRHVQHHKNNENGAKI